ncbi:hypothetical protein Ciccas_005409 [Cichlidogyrus casuarinus]|uniref:Uncharacterized protein n=1 Tax=Cichlidogyrus casuarinus TaxID=1844966 RepID=A0ABD2Q8Q3_9PLAT
MAGSAILSQVTSTGPATTLDFNARSSYYKNNPPQSEPKAAPIRTRNSSGNLPPFRNSTSRPNLLFESQASEPTTTNGRIANTRRESRSSQRKSNSVSSRLCLKADQFVSALFDAS